jgi:DNA-binding IclR family transcriptional regulator
LASWRLIRKARAASPLDDSASASVRVGLKPLNQLQRLIRRQPDKDLTAVPARTRVERQQHIARIRERRHVRMGGFVDQNDSAR